MIFLFGTSVAHLEPELERFKERSIFASLQVWQKSHRKTSILFKKRPGFAHFPRPAETDPYVHTMLCCG